MTPRAMHSLSREEALLWRELSPAGEERKHLGFPPASPSWAPLPRSPEQAAALLGSAASGEEVPGAKVLGPGPSPTYSRFRGQVIAAEGVGQVGGR